MDVCEKGHLWAVFFVGIRVLRGRDGGEGMRRLWGEGSDGRGVCRNGSKREFVRNSRSENEWKRLQKESCVREPFGEGGGK